MPSPRHRRGLQIADIGLVGVTAGIAGLWCWNCLSASAPPPNSSLSNASAAHSPAHPTSIPWITDQATCAKTDRLWRDEQCWDYRHDPSF